MDRVTAFRDANNDYRWIRRDEAGEHLALSEEGYPTLHQALDAARQTHPGLPVRAVDAPAFTAPAAVACDDDDEGTVETSPADPVELVELAAHDEGPPCAP